MHRGRVAHPVAAAHHRIVDDRQTALGEDHLHHRLVHAHRRGEHAAADIGDVGELEQPLHRAVFAIRTVQHREDHVETEAGHHRARAVLVTTGAAIDAQDRLVAGVRDEVHLALTAQEAPRLDAGMLDHVRRRHRRRRPIRDRPAPILVDAQRDGLVARAIEVAEDGGRRGERDLVLARPSSVDDADAKPLHGLTIVSRRSSIVN